jgi:uncharacterized protein (DUF1778 family)
MPDMDDPRLEKAMEALAGEAEGMNEGDPRQAARLMRKIFDATGMPMKTGMEEAIRRMESGEDPEKIEQEMGDVFEEDPFGGDSPLRRPGWCNDNVITSCYAGLLAEGLLMPTAQQEKAKRDTLNLRIKPELRGLIDRAAELSGKTRTDFMLDAARVAAEDALMDRTVFAVNPKAYAEFLARLDASPRPNDRLRRSLRTTAPWEK